jgi:hypothetical protein
VPSGGDRHRPRRIVGVGSAPAAFGRIRATRRFVNLRRYRDEPGPDFAEIRLGKGSRRARSVAEVAIRST